MWGIIGGLSYIADCYVNNESINLFEAGMSVLMGIGSGAIGGPGANEGMVMTDAIEYMGKTAAREARRTNQKYAMKAITRTAYYGNNVLSASAWEASMRFAAGTGVSSGVLGWLSNSGLFPTWLEWDPS